MASPGGAPMGAPPPAAAAPPAGAPGAAMAPPAAMMPVAPTAKKEAEVAGGERPEQRPQAGQLTAGVWDDNRNFDFFRPYAASYEQKGGDYRLFSLDEQRAAIGRSAARAPRSELDVQLIIDTTGSMGDELSYLQSEFDAIAGQLRARFPQVVPRWSLVVYRDHGDEYVTRRFEFSDAERFRGALRQQAAGGGGDFPEAVVEGLKAGLDQQWRTSANVARLAFWVADAPTHQGEGAAFASLVRKAQQMDVHLYPVASSGIDDTAEFQMRSAAQLTGGRYIFLTDDSGVGNSHAEPHIPCYSVTRLDQAITRMIEIELSGQYTEAKNALRSVGQPDKGGRCKLANGKEVAAY